MLLFCNLFLSFVHKKDPLPIKFRIHKGTFRIKRRETGEREDGVLFILCYLATKGMLLVTYLSGLFPELALTSWEWLPQEQYVRVSVTVPPITK